MSLGVQDIWTKSSGLQQCYSNMVIEKGKVKCYRLNLKKEKEKSERI